MRGMTNQAIIEAPFPSRETSAQVMSWSRPQKGTPAKMNSESSLRATLRVGQMANKGTTNHVFCASDGREAALNLAQGRDYRETSKEIKAI